MKNIYLTLLLLIAAIGVQAQTMIKVKSKNLVQNDSIWMPKYGREIIIIPANATGDTVRSVDYIYHPTSDTTITFPLTIRYYDKNGAVLSTVDKSPPANIFLRWTLLQSKIYQWIFANTRKLQQQN